MHTPDSSDSAAAVLNLPEVQVVCALAYRAGDCARRHFFGWHGNKLDGVVPGGGSAVPGLGQVEWKEGEEPVTATDKAVSDLCVSGLRAAFPEDAVLSEEVPDDGARLSARRTWLVDPIDGTKDFIAGRVGFSVMIGLLDERGPAFGVVYQPLESRLWFAVRGRGAYEVRGEGTAASAPRRLSVSTVDTLTAARMVSSASVREPMVAELRERAGIRDEFQIGSVGIKLSLLAAGERDLYVNPAGKTKLWDTCAPEVILHEAGGRLSNLAGEPLDYRGELAHTQGLVASNGVLHETALAQLRPFLAASRPSR